MRVSAAARLGLGVLALLAPTGAVATSFVEEGDAPALFPAQAVAGDSGSLASILGGFQTASDVDLYRIRVADPGAFSVGVDGGGNSDPMVHVFTTDARGIAAMNDVLLSVNSSGLPLEVSRDPFIPAGHPLFGDLTAGSDVVIGVSTYIRTPLAARAAPLFRAYADFEIAGPLEVLGGPIGPLEEWSVGSYPSNFTYPADYTIELTGAAFVPEPAPVVLIAAGLAVLSVARRRRPRRSGSQRT